MAAAGAATVRASRSRPPTEIAFAGVTVTYPGRTAPALDGFDLVIPERGVVALVGATGAGKTTAANLLLRFIEPDAGSILVGGVPLASIDLAAWRSHVAWVPQRPYLFHGSVADNIRLARPDASDDGDPRCRPARPAPTRSSTRCRAATTTPVGEDGTRLSGGQRQRIALARAFLAGARLVILDEATSHLDAASEDLIRDAVERARARPGGARRVAPPSARVDRRRRRRRRSRAGRPGRARRRTWPHATAPSAGCSRPTHAERRS